MSDVETSIQDRLAALKRELELQGRLVEQVIDTAVEAVFDKDAEKARRVVEHDEVIDRVDVQIERDAVALLTDATSASARDQLSAADIRLVLTIVKVNNEFERIADLAVTIANQIDRFVRLEHGPPPKFRVMANSVIGMMQTTNTAFAEMDGDLARLVLSSDDATEQFKDAILRDVEECLSRGEHSVDYSFALQWTAASLARMSDHCTNVAEQVIYVATGKIVRHANDRWSDPEPPNTHDQANPAGPTGTP